jgi:cell division protein FtsL
MTRLNLLLVALLLASALHLVYTSYQARRLFTELDRARAEQQRLDAEYRRLDTERQAQGTRLRVERVARDKLAMRQAVPGITVYVSEAASSAASGAPR